MGAGRLRAPPEQTRPRARAVDQPARAHGATLRIRMFAKTGLMANIRTIGESSGVPRSESRAIVAGVINSDPFCRRGIPTGIRSRSVNPRYQVAAPAVSLAGWAGHGYRAGRLKSVSWRRACRLRGAVMPQEAVARTIGLSA